MENVLYYIALWIVLIVGLSLNILSLPGNWIMLLAMAGYGWRTGWQYFGWGWMLTLLVLAAIAEVIEFLAAGTGAKRAGGTMWGTVGALVGALLGAIFLTALIPIPVLGTLIGILIGTFAGAMTAEMVTGQKATRSVLIGYGAAKGRLYGTLIKIGFGCMMLLLSVIVAFPRVRASAAPTSQPAPLAPTTSAVAVSQ